VQPEDIPLQVLYEDEHIIVLNKSPDIIVHPARAHNKGTLINALAYHFAHRSPAGGALSEVGKEFARPGVVHRLDRQTSGLIVFAKDDTAHWRLARQFELRTVDKRYLALVHGLVEPPIEVIDLPLGPHPSREKGYREKYVVRHDALGKPSVTICRVRAHFGGKPALPAGLPEAPVPEVLKRPGWAMPGESLRTASAGSAGSESRHTYSLVELELKTGRTHQIRVHLSHNGYPIVGDDMYGGRPLMRADLDPAAAGDPEEPPLIARQALHAALLAFRHPITNAPMAFTAPLPPDFSNALSALVAADPAARRLDPPGSSVNLGTMLPG
jgi:23S rRNA pseudouridine1911/1915/1917 synthase